MAGEPILGFQGPATWGSNGKTFGTFSTELTIADEFRPSLKFVAIGAVVSEE
jgi:hypothetical protein